MAIRRNHLSLDNERPTLLNRVSFVWKNEEEEKSWSVRKTKIVCTLGPASWDTPKIVELLKSGMNVARMNFSHGDHPTHARSIANVREASKQTGISCAILLDNKGPEIRTGLLKDKNIMLQAGQTLEILCGGDKNFQGGLETISLDYENLPAVVNIGDSIKIDDGLIVCTVTGKEKGKVVVRVENTAELGTYKGVNLPGVKVDLPALTKRDEADLLFGVDQQVDFIAASFIRKASDIRGIRELLGEKGKLIKIISKIENQEGLDNFDSILVESDGIMVARGDLGVEIPIQKVSTAQKMMIKKCNLAGKPVITATQMLDSMIVNPRPTRAEATDVANAVFDGSDAVMLSGETAKGSYPNEAVQIMARICTTSESALDYDSQFLTMITSTPKPISIPECVTSSAVKAVLDLSAKLVIVLTESGATSRFLAKYKPPVPVLCSTPNQKTARQCFVSRALIPLVCKSGTSEADRIEQALAYARDLNWVSKGDSVVLVRGEAAGTDSMQIKFA